MIEPIEEKHTELLVLKTFEDIRSRPAFREDLDPNQHKIAKLIGDYTFKEKVHCGLHSCHTPHNTGFLAVTEDNLETIVGNVCGRKWGGDDFIYQKRLFKRQKTFQQNLITLKALVENKNTLENRIKEIKDRKFGAKWLISSLKEFREICPYEILSELSKRSINGDYRVVEHRERSYEDIERLHSMSPRQPKDNFRYEEIPLGLLSGVDIFNSDIHKTLIINVLNVITELSKRDIHSIKLTEQKKYIEFSNNYEREFEHAEALLKSAWNFFEQKNLDLLPFLIKEKKKRGRRIKWDKVQGKPIL